MSLIQPKFLELLRTPLKEIFNSEECGAKKIRCVVPDDKLGDCLPLIDIQQQSKTNPLGITTLIVSPTKNGQRISDLSSVHLLDSREIVSAYYYYLKENDAKPSHQIIQGFLNCTMDEISRRAPKIDKVKFVNWNFKLADILGEFGSNTRLIVHEIDGETNNMKFVFSVKDFLKLLDKHDLLRQLGDKSHPNELNSTPLLSFASTLRKPLSLIANDPRSLCCALKDEPVISTLHKLVASHHRGLPVIGDLRGGSSRPDRVMAICSCSDFVTYLLRWQEFLAVGMDIQSSSTLPFVSMVKQMICLQAINPCISMNIDENLYDTLQRMKTCKIHRLMISNANHDVCGLVSVSDIGRFIASEAAAIFDEAAL